MLKYLKYGYLITISAVLPLYMERGYYQLGEGKGIAYMVISLFFALLFLLAENRKFIQTDKLPSHLSYAICVFLFSNILSFIYSVDKKKSFLGLSGWRYGLVSILLIIFFFYVFYDGEKISGYVLAAVMITPLFEGILAIANRFSLYPVEVYGKDPAFLATIGNINWLVGYFSVFVPLGIGLCYREKLFSRKFLGIGVYVLITLSALMLQGSDSGAVVIAASYVVLLIFSIGERHSFRKFLALVFILGLSMEGACVLYMFYGKSYSYTENMLLTICNMHVGLILAAFVLFIFCISHLFEAVGFGFLEKTYRYIAGFIVAILLFTAAYYVVTSFDYKMGNGRGLIYSLSLDMFGRMDPVRMLFGAGQECYSVYAYSDPETADSLLNIYGGNILTNAHCAPLTILIERGLFGLFSYILLIALLAKEILAQKNKHAKIISALILSSYLINSFVSFDLVISTPYLFLALAICLSSKEVRE